MRRAKQGRFQRDDLARWEVTLFFHRRKICKSASFQLDDQADRPSGTLQKLTHDPSKSLGTPTFEPRLELQIARLLHCFNNVPTLCRASILDKRLGYVARTGPCRLEDFQSHQILKRLRKGIVKPQDMGRTNDRTIDSPQP